MHRYGKADQIGVFATADEANAAWAEEAKYVSNPETSKPAVRLLLRGKM